MKILRLCIYFIFVLFVQNSLAKDVEDFNFGWKFHLGDLESAYFEKFDDTQWDQIRVPHDWSVQQPYSKQDTSSSTGFKPGAIGWYRKSFELDSTDLDKVIWVEFDGIYNNSQIWVNGHFAAERPSGYSSFQVQLNPHMKKGKNVISVKVDRTAYADARWYTGSGIYRNVRLVKANPVHFPQWATQITTPSVSQKSALVSFRSTLEIPENAPERLYLHVAIYDAEGKLQGSEKQRFGKNSEQVVTKITIDSPALWNTESPTLYTAKLAIKKGSKTYDQQILTFGIRSIEFTADRGFLLNGKQTKIKGVNLHHDAGAVGAAVPKEIWRFRLEKLASIGVNAIRMAHNPHSPELLELCDEMGFLVMAESFDDWQRAKDKSLVFLSDNAAKGDAASSYTEHFEQWAERDLVDLIHRDFNHPSIVMWSIGNEIEWTYPYYAASQIFQTKSDDYHGKLPPIYDPERVKKEFLKNKGAGLDHLALTAHYLSNIVKRLDTSRPVTAGLVIPSVDFVSGYADALDVAGFNYRSQEYDIAHQTYPDKPLIGSENWGSWPEWKAVLERDFIPGIFVWTGFAYKGEAGPWPRKGLEISFFDFAGHKTPRGHQFESFWIPQPKVYLATVAAEDSEYQQSENGEWVFTERKYPIAQMQWLRPWEWYGVEEKWHAETGREMVVHVYSNTQQSELYLNGNSLGKQSLSDENNRILFWQVPFQAGTLKVVGYNDGKAVSEYQLSTYEEVASIELTSNKLTLVADQYDVAHINLNLLDKNGNRVFTQGRKINFTVEGPAELLAVDNGWENSVEQENSSSITPHSGRALAIIRAGSQPGNVTVSAQLEDGATAKITLVTK